MRMNRNDVLIAYLGYSEDSANGKRRPVLVIEKDEDIVHVFKITSKFHYKSATIQKQYYQIRDWQFAGLNRESWIDIGVARSIDLSVLKVKAIGSLSSQDRKGLAKFIEHFYNFN